MESRKWMRVKIQLRRRKPNGKRLGAHSLSLASIHKTLRTFQSESSIRTRHASLNVLVNISKCWDRERGWTKNWSGKRKTIWDCDIYYYGFFPSVLRLARTWQSFGTLLLLFAQVTTLLIVKFLDVKENRATNLGRERERGIERTQKWVRQMTGEHRIADLAVNFIALWTTSICSIAMPAANSSDCDCGFHTLALHSIRLIKCVYVLLNLFIFTFEYIVRKRGAGMSKRFGFAKTSSINAQISRQTAW